MSAVIHPTALVHPGASIASGVRIGPWCQIGPDVVIEGGAVLKGSVIVEGRTRIGADTEIFPFTTIGLAPQDLKYQGEPTSCEIGARCVVREGVSIHRGTSQGAGRTSVGADSLIMANAHIAHDCFLEDGVIIVNNVVMGGHVQIGREARIMGAAALHQFVRVGAGAVVGGVCGVERDVIPYGCVIGNRAFLTGLNWVGLKRSGALCGEIQEMRRAFEMLYPRKRDASSSFALRVEKVAAAFPESPRIQEIVEFIRSPSRRGLTVAKWAGQEDGAF